MIICSFCLQVVVRGKGKGQVHRLTHSLKRLGRSVGRRQRSAVARQAVNDPRIRRHILAILGKNVRKEMHKMCSFSNGSCLRDSSPSDLFSFSWGLLANELESNAPTLFSFLHSATSIQVPPSRVRKRTHRVKQTPIIGICAAILLRHRCCSMNLV